MAEHGSNRAANLAVFEREAEVIAAQQLDLLAQMEAQLRAVHRMMRGIEKLRAERLRIGPELTNGQRGTTLASLATDITAIDQELQVQHQTCFEMQQSIREMQRRLATLRTLAAIPSDNDGEPEGSSDGSRQA
jgi:prefoldin subunit 5